MDDYEYTVTGVFTVKQGFKFGVGMALGYILVKEADLVIGERIKPYMDRATAYLKNLPTE